MKMAHFAKINDNNYVDEVIVVANEDILDENGQESEAIGVQFCRDLTGHQKWVQTSYNGSFRNKFAGVGDWYNETADTFHFPFWINPVTGKEFTEEEWAYIKFYETYRQTYRFYPAIPADSDDNEILFYCHNNDNYTYVPPDYLTWGTYKIKTEALKWVEHPTSAANFKVKNDFAHDKVLDIGSIGIVVRCSSHTIDQEIISHLRKIHPYYAGGSPHELFRLMLEWAYAYEEMGNTEPMAVRCASALAVLNIPQEVKQELLAKVPDQGVARYLNGLPQVDNHELVDMPPLFQQWWSTVSTDTWRNVKPI